MPPNAKIILKHTGRTMLVAVLLSAILAGAGSTYAQAYDGEIYPGVFIGPIDVGGLTHEEAAVRLSEAVQAALEDGLILSHSGNVVEIPLTNEGLENPDASFDLVVWDIDAAVNEALAVGRGDNLLRGMFEPSVVLATKKQIAFSPTIDEPRITSEIVAAFPELNHPSRNAWFNITPEADHWFIEVEEGSEGTVIDTDQILTDMRSNLETELFVQAMDLPVIDQSPTVSAAEAESLVVYVQTILAEAPYTLTYTDEHYPKSWMVDAEDLVGMLEAEKENEVVHVGLSQMFGAFVRETVESVLVPAEDARFLIQDGRVVEFQGSQAGVDLDEDATVSAVEDILGVPEATAEIVVMKTEAQIATGDVNDLGITEILGVGTSDFSGSPGNRIKNIQNGATLLNGLLIKPNETFSLLAALRPFTYDNGYLPELVIKGDKIEPEVGGGLCQIGTTTFRAAMNSGLPIVERRNHSLVVRYYNDPSNGNPGTDATIYDPSPDFKFLNDTGNYILFTTEVDMESMQLYFTFWGTSDGRKGSYTPPVVSAWYGAGATRYIETTDMAPGTQKCQGSHVGANASFTYTIERPDGTIEEELFTSAYRPLPTICLVGVESLSTEEEQPATDGEEESTSEDPASEAEDPSEETTEPVAVEE